VTYLTSASPPLPKKLVCKERSFGEEHRDMSASAWALGLIRAKQGAEYLVIGRCEELCRWSVILLRPRLANVSSFWGASLLE